MANPRWSPISSYSRSDLCQWIMASFQSPSPSRQYRSPRLFEASATPRFAPIRSWNSSAWWYSFNASSAKPCRCSTVPRLSEIVADINASLPALADSSARPKASRATARSSSRAAAIPTARYAAARSRSTDCWPTSRAIASAPSRRASASAPRETASIDLAIRTRASCSGLPAPSRHASARASPSCADAYVPRRRWISAI